VVWSVREGGTGILCAAAAVTSTARVTLAELQTGGFTALCVHIGKMKKLKNKTVVEVRRRGKNDKREITTDFLSLSLSLSLSLAKG
jgi:hypothetical protein